MLIESNVPVTITAGKKSKNYNSDVHLSAAGREHFVKDSPFHGGHVCSCLRPYIVDRWGAVVLHMYIEAAVWY